MKKVIVIIAGGDSSEHDVSMRSAAGIHGWLDQSKYDAYIVEMTHDKWIVKTDDGACPEVDRHDFSFEVNCRRIVPDYAYITIHGTPGEDGILQGYLDLMHIPYSTSDVLVEAMTFNKFVLNQYLKGFGVKVADSLLIRRGQECSSEDVVSRLGLPCFVKPNGGGSSFGVTRCKSLDEIGPAIDKAFCEWDEVVIESELKGTEISNGVYRSGDGVRVLPITEVVSDNEFFDYDAKYNGQVEEITPARLSDDTTRRVQAVTKEIYGILGAKGIIRIDYIITKRKKDDGSITDVINLLEINTTPGMTPTSFIPQQVRAAGLEMQDVLDDVIMETGRIF